MIQSLLRKIPAPISGELIVRKEGCKICDEKTAIRISTVDYWDIKTSQLVKCPKCNHIQLDPMLNDEETSKGCLAYYIEESLRTSAKEQQKNCVRNFRRGVVFGYSLKRKSINPHSVLELGPGSGYFLAGLQFVFPKIEVTVMDINQEVLDFNQVHHHYKTILAVPDNFMSEYEEKFDLIIGRDILEHVTDISKVISNVNRYLARGGHFHFMTPNGHEDVWKHYITSKLTNLNSELLINHVNYFDGKGLKDLMIQKGLNPIDYYTYKIKTTIRGRGWKQAEKLMSPISKKTNADFFINEKASEISNIELVKSDVLKKWYIQNNSKLVTYLYCLNQHKSIIRINPELNIGHEIYGLFKKMN
jgi:2-polyprenyl-3-methyl-5-hydroxy-6-metoxy-1,4-benzoquinol methylase